MPAYRSPLLRALVLGGLSLAAVGVAAPARAADPMTAPDRSWVDVTGRVGVVGPSSFTLDYASGSIIVEVDDDTRVAAGNTVTVYGRIAAADQRRSIEAQRVVVHGAGVTLGGRDAEVPFALGPSPAVGDAGTGPTPSAPVVPSRHLAAPTPSAGVDASAPVVSSGTLAAPAPTAPVVRRDGLAAGAATGAPPAVSSARLGTLAAPAPRTAEGHDIFTGKVVAIDDHSFVLDAGDRRLVVELDGLGYDPFDGRDGHRLRPGDRVTVSGVLEAGLGTDGRLLARSLRYERGNAPG